MKPRRPARHRTVIHCRRRATPGRTRGRRAGGRGPRKAGARVGGEGKPGGGSGGGGGGGDGSAGGCGGGCCPPRPPFPPPQTAATLGFPPKSYGGYPFHRPPLFSPKSLIFPNEASPAGAPPDGNPLPAEGDDGADAGATGGGTRAAEGGSAGRWRREARRRQRRLRWRRGRQRRRLRRRWLPTTPIIPTSTGRGHAWIPPNKSPRIPLSPAAP